MNELEKAQKLNTLARSLLDNGLVADFDSAQKMAEGMLDKKEVSLKEASEEDITKTEQKTSNEDIEKLKRTTEMLRKYVGEAQEKINGIIADVRNIKNELRELKQQEAKEKESREVKAKAKEDNIKEEKGKENAEKAEETQKEKKEPHPRQGNYNSDDVSVEKFFYYGKKEEK